MRTLVSVVVLVTVSLVVAAVGRLMWRQRTSARDTAVALVTTAALAAWAAVAALLAYQGAFTGSSGEAVPPVGIALGSALAGTLAALAGSQSLRRLLGSQADLTRLHAWRLLGAVFVLMMLWSRLPALFALPAGLGDIAIGATATWMARHADRPGGRRLIAWHGLGLADLVLAVALGITTSPGPSQIFHTVPTSEAMTMFPLAVVPVFLVPLALTLHCLSLARLAAGHRTVKPLARSSVVNA